MPTKQSKNSKQVVDLLIEYYLEENGTVPRVVCAYGHPDMVYDVLEKTKYGVSKQNKNSGWGTQHRRGVARINRALRQDTRFKEVRVRGIRNMVGFQFIGDNT